MLAQGEIDWSELKLKPTVQSIEAAALDAPHSARIYVATPIRQYIERGEAHLAIEFAGEWQAWLLSEGYSAVCPALLTIMPMFQRGDDPVGQMLRAMDHDWWMRRCLPWMEACEWCVVPPIAGWLESEGAWQEAMTFARWGRPVRLLRGRP